LLPLAVLLMACLLASLSSGTVPLQSAGGAAGGGFGVEAVLGAVGGGLVFVGPVDFFG
jgi:hypothetical protein